MTTTPPEPDTVAVPRAIYEQLARWAACWHAWWTPAAVAYRADEFERAWTERIRTASHDVSAARDWTNPAGFPVGHAELQQRRYPWLYDPHWRCRHGRPHRQCGPCAAGHGPLDWHTGQPLTTRKDTAA